MNKYLKILAVLFIALCFLLPARNSYGFITQETLQVKETEKSNIQHVVETKVRNNEFFEKEKQFNFVKVQEEKIVKEDFSNTIKVKIVPSVRDIINQKLLNLETEIEMLAKIIYREARGIDSTTEQAAVVWVVLNRVDAGDYGESIKEVIKKQHQFAWVPNTPIIDDFYELAKDVITRWLLEKEGYTENGRIIPSSYKFFASHDDGKNYFREEYESSGYWDFSWQSPYTN